MAARPGVDITIRGGHSVLHPFAIGGVINITTKKGQKTDDPRPNVEDHLQEYEPFAQKLESANKDESPRNIRIMMELISQGNESLKRALKAL
ncbi:MAG: hypothetical protein R6U38_08435 [Desulfatiglandaceae bacterium]